PAPVAATPAPSVPVSAPQANVAPVPAAAPAPMAAAPVTAPAAPVAPAQPAAAKVPPWEDAPAAADAAQAAAATAQPASPANAAAAGAPAKTASPSAAPAVAQAPAPHAPATDTPAVSAAPVPAKSAPLAVTPAAAAVAPAADDDGPPSWVDEEIPFEAEGGFVPDAGFAPDGGFTSDPDDDFETLASAPSSAPAPSAAPARREGPAPARKRQSRARLADMTSAAWPELAARLPVTGLAAELARQSEWAGVQGDAIILRVAVKTLAESESRVRLQTVLCEHFGQGIRLDVDVGAVGEATAHAVAQAERAARQQAAEDAVAVDPFVQALVADFGAHVVAGSIRHVDSPSAAA
ncbi:DNA polymerase III subunit gamma/tau C-terminal domain-containing protein, partial [Achromobacter xylosoxidans]|uniref:DNA polymerase III subunit gamma/tau C-terminal domain-containing protein n=1 Tax=Alcaligenes xylosoxydans xylosoxydans TaxID=85698 RepID=UPI0022CD01A2|nr:DNA polymerase III subunit gamma/tau [Achromobacter xylosoxidans]